MYTFYPFEEKSYSTHNILSDLFTPKDCYDILEISKEYESHIPKIINFNNNEIDNTGYSNAKITSFPWKESYQWIFDKLTNAIYESNDKYFHLELSGINEELDVIQYDVGGGMDWHADGLGIGKVGTRKISMSIQLTDPTEYEGGWLELFLGKQPNCDLLSLNCPKGLGTIVLFPSYMYHRVTQVTKGTRTSLVVHAHGRPFK